MLAKIIGILAIAVLCFVIYPATITLKNIIVSKFKGDEPIPVTGKTFENEVVPLDGYVYTNCVFKNVKFRYEGNGKKFGLLNSRIEGGIRVDLGDNQGLVTYTALLSKLGLLKPGLPIYQDNILVPDLSVPGVERR